MSHLGPNIAALVVEKDGRHDKPMVDTASREAHENVHELRMRSGGAAGSTGGLADGEFVHGCVPEDSALTDAIHDVILCKVREQGLRRFRLKKESVLRAPPYDWETCKSSVWHYLQASIGFRTRIAQA